MQDIISDTNPKDNRCRQWVMVLYPESAPDDWLRQLKDFHITLVISPLHDKDVHPDGTPKKPHYHIFLDFGASKKSFTQVKFITDALNCPIPQICNSKKGQIRYFIHIDDPDKYQYDRNDLQVYGDLDLDEIFSLSVDAELNIVDQILDYCTEHDITEYFQLIDYARKSNKDWFRYMNKNTYLIREYLKSKNFYQRAKKQEQQRYGSTPQDLIKELDKR